MIKNEINLNDLNEEQLLDLFYNDTKKFRHDRSQILRKYLELNKNESDKIRQEIIFELLLLDLHCKLDGERFAPMIVYTNNHKYPDLDLHFKDESIEYYKLQLNKINNPILKSKMADFLAFKIRQDFNKYSLIAIDEYLKTIDIFFKNDWELELIDSIIHSLQLSISLNNDDKIKSVIDKFKTILDKLKENKKYLSIEKILKFIFDNNKKLQYNLNLHIKLLKEISKEFSENKNHFRARSILELISKLNKDNDDYENDRIKIALSFIEEGNSRIETDKSQIMVLSYFYENAIKIYSEFGKKYQKKIDELKHNIIESNKTSESSFKKIEHKFEIKKEQFDEFLLPYKNKEISELIEIFATDLRFIIDYNKTLEMAENQLKQPTLLSVIPRKVMKEGYVVKTITENENLDYQAKWNYNFSLNFNSFLLNRIFELFENEKTHFDKNIIDFLNNSEIINDTRLELISKGLERFREKDYISTLYILTFQIEGLLRDFAFKLRIPIYKETFKIEMSAVLFPELLRAFIKIKGFPEGFFQLIEMFLVDILGFNIRNDLAHGLVEKNIFTKENCEYLIYIIVHLSIYNVNKEDKEKND